MNAFSQKIARIFSAPAFVNRWRVAIKTGKLVSFPDERTAYLSKKYENLAKDISNLVVEPIRRSAKKAGVESPRWAVNILKSEEDSLRHTLQGGSILVGGFTLDLKKREITTTAPDGKKHVYPAKQAAYALRLLCQAIEEMPESKKTKGLF